MKLVARGISWGDKIIGAMVLERKTSTVCEDIYVDNGEFQRAVFHWQSENSQKLELSYPAVCPMPGTY